MISFTDGKEIGYVYSASGEKLQIVVNGKTLTYCGIWYLYNGKEKQEGTKWLDFGVGVLHYGPLYPFVFWGP